MQIRTESFYSDGIRLEGAFLLPAGDAPDPTRPLIVPCSGYTGLRRIHPERFARALTPRGYACFGFDYRGFAPSEGEPGLVYCEEQARDIRNAATFASAACPVPHQGVVLVGWGMGGGLVLEAAPQLEGLRGVVCVNGFYDALRVQKALRGEDGWREFTRWLASERREAVADPAPRWADPFQIYPLDPVSRGYVDAELRRVDGYEGDRVRTSFADSLLAFAPQRQAEALEVPLLIAHGRDNALHPPAEAEALAAACPDAQQLWLEGGHTEWMLDDHPTFLALVAGLEAWLQALP